jgi:hypothetical protein
MLGLPKTQTTQALMAEEQMAKPVQQYGNKSTPSGPKKNMNESHDPRGTSDQPFSQMQMTDHKEHHNKQIKNMSAPATHQKSLPIRDGHAYKEQSHSVKPSGPIQSFVGNRIDSKASKAPIVSKSNPKGEYQED